MTAKEFNFDGLVGPTHHFGGHAKGNVASEISRGSTSNPRLAALQGLDKMKALYDLGIPQAVLPPHERPFIPFLRRIGFIGSDEEVLAQAQKEDLPLLMAASSSAAMWCANAATITPSKDSADHRLHFTAANLYFALHRSLEAQFNRDLLATLFYNPNFFHHHDPLPSISVFSDEGAANQTRFCTDYGDNGLHLFVYGRYGLPQAKEARLPSYYPARHTLEASLAIARQHHLNPNQTLFVQQNPHAIDAGVFHNDVISTGNKNLFLCHEEAFLDNEAVLKALQEKASANQLKLQIVLVSRTELSLQNAVSTYFFNSQVVALPDGTMALIAPEECREHPQAAALCKRLVDDPTIPIKKVLYFPLRESMRNGGGPACLRLRVVLTAQEQQAMHQGVLFQPELYTALKEWITAHYRDHLTWQDLGDPKLMREAREALDKLTRLLKLGSIYPFQRGH